jgi:predicted SAM-dependent methyltransferase
MIKLDLGCGQHKLEGYIGLDIEPFEGVDYIVDICDHIPYPDNSVGLINCTQVLEHLENPLDALKEMHRISTDDAVITLSIPNLMNVRRFLRWMVKGKTTVAKNHIQGWGLPELINIADRAGLIYLYHSYDTYSRYHKLNVIEKLIKWIIPRIGNKHLKVVFGKK